MWLPSCSQAHHWFWRLFPSTWCDEVAQPQKNPSGNLSAIPLSPFLLLPLRLPLFDYHLDDRRRLQRLPVLLRFVQVLRPHVVQLADLARTRGLLQQPQRLTDDPHLRVAVAGLTQRVAVGELHADGAGHTQP